MKNNQFPIPSQVNPLEKVREAKIFSKLDLWWGFNNIHIREGDKQKTTFCNKDDFYKYTVVPFGLNNTPAMFQCFMNHILCDLVNVCVVVYLDDILIYSRNKEDQTQQVQEVLRHLKENNLSLELTKCHFYITTIATISIVISPNGVSMEKEKIKVIIDWKEPKKVMEQQAFLGFTNFY